MPILPGRRSALIAAFPIYKGHVAHYTRKKMGQEEEYDYLFKGKFCHH